MKTLNLKRIATAICLVALLVSPFAFAAAQNETTDKVIMSYEAEDEEIDESSSNSDFLMDFYFSFLTMDKNKNIGDQIGAKMPKYGIGLGYRSIFGSKSYFYRAWNFGGYYGFRTYTYAPTDNEGNALNSTDRDVRSSMYSFNMDFALGGSIFFTKNRNNGVNLFAGFGFDYTAVKIDKAKPGNAMYYDYTIAQYGFYVPMGVRLFFKGVTLTATYRLRAFDIDMTIKDRKSTTISADETLKQMPLEISLGIPIF